MLTLGTQRIIEPKFVFCIYRPPGGLSISRPHVHERVAAGAGHLGFGAD